MCYVYPNLTLINLFTLMLMCYMVKGTNHKIPHPTFTILLFCHTSCVQILSLVLCHTIVTYIIFSRWQKN